MRRWPLVPLAQAAHLVMGQSPPGTTYNTSGNGTPLLNGPAEFGTTNPTAVQWTTAPTRLCKAGDILFCVRGATTGRKNWADRDYAIGRGLAAIRGRDGIADTLYLWFVLDYITHRLVSEAAGSTFVNLPGAKLAAFPIPLPPFAKQKRIASGLSAAMEQVEKAKALQVEALDAAQQLEVTVLQASFPLSPPLSVDGDVQSAPRGWQWTLLTDVARLETGHTPSRSRGDWWGGDILWLALPDIRKLDGQVVNKTSETTNPEGLANSSARLLPKDTVALSRTASVGFVSIFGQPMATSQDFVNWVCGDKLQPRFLMHLLRASRPYLLELASGATHKTIYMNTVERFRVCMPDVGQQKRLTAAIDSALGQIPVLKDTLSKQHEALNAFPARLLAETFGEPD